MELVLFFEKVVSGFVEALKSVLFFDVLFFIQGIHLPFIIFWVIFAGIYFTVKLKFISFRKLGESFKIFFEREVEEKNGRRITSRSAFLGTISGFVGVGSISGVAAAIYYGGPGVIFWLLAASFLVMPVRFAEVFLGHHFRSKNESGEVVLYGPFAYIKNGLSNEVVRKVALVVFALCLIMVSVGAVTFQAGPTAELISETLFDGGITPKIIFCLAVAVFCLCVVLGGLRRISHVISKLASTMALSYIAIILVILAVNFQALPSAFILILKSAFTFEGATGGALVAIIVAFTRIITMSEVGMGTGAILHGMSQNEDSRREALLAMSGPFVATVIFVALNGFAVVATGSHGAGANGALMIYNMFAAVHPVLGFGLIGVMMLFAVTTLIAWYFYVETAIKTLSNKPIFVALYRVCFVALIVLSGFLSFGTLVGITDTIGISVIIPNIIILILLGKHIKNL